MRFIRLHTLTICIYLAMAMLVLGCVSLAQEQITKGDSFLKQEQWDEAIGAYNKAIVLNPKLAGAQLNTKLAVA